MTHQVHVVNERGEAQFSLDESGWVDTYAKYLEGGRITLLDGGSLSVDTSGHRWVLFYRNIGHMKGGQGMVRVLCVGWQDTVNGVNVKALNWVYPNGFIEMSEEPTFWKHFI